MYSNKSTNTVALYTIRQILDNTAESSQYSRSFTIQQSRLNTAESSQYGRVVLTRQNLCSRHSWQSVPDVRGSTHPKMPGRIGHKFTANAPTIDVGWVP